MGSWQLTSYFPIYVLAVLVSFFVAILGWRMRPARGATYFSLMFVGVGIWSLGYLLGFFNTDLQWKLIMIRVEYLGDVSSLYFWMLFVIAFVQYEHWLKKRVLILLAVVPLTTYLFVLFMNQSGFFFKSYYLINREGMIQLATEYNIGFYLFVIYAYLGLIGGSGILLWGVLHQPKFFQTQNILIVLLVAIILLANSMYIFDINPMGVYDPTPLTFVIAGILLTVMLWRYKLFDIVPIAHHNVFKNVRIGVIIIDEKNRILDMNPSAEQVLGKTENQVLGSLISEVLPDLEPLFVEGAETSEDKIEITLQHGKRIFEIQKTPLFDKKNQTIGNIIMLYDITELKHTLSELNAFAHTVAHDLKSPLAGQWTRIELLKNSNLSGDEIVEAYQDISRGANKMMSIVDALLLLADVRNKSNVKCEPMDMGQVVQNVLDRLEGFIIQNKGTIHQPEKWPEALGYAPWIEEVWSNYINNAIKYGGSPPVVELGADEYENHIRFWVKDNGEGLSQEEIDSLFKEFQRLERHASTTAGHGLGLSVVSRIMNKLGSEAGVISDGKTGCTFYFTLKTQE